MYIFQLFRLFISMTLAYYACEMVDEYLKPFLNDSGFSLTSTPVWFFIAFVKMSICGFVAFPELVFRKF